MRQSEQISDLASALAKAQGAMDHASKDRTNPAFKSRYADLASVVDACRPALSANGIAVLQPARLVGGSVEVDTMLVHQTGQWIAETLCASVPDSKAQTIGSAITYLRRYGLSSMVGVAPDDDDGNGATGPRRDDRSTANEPPARQDPPTRPAAATAPDPHRADVVAEAHRKTLAAFPAAAPEINEALARAATPDAALDALRRIYSRLSTAAGTQKPLVQRTQAEAVQVKRVRDAIAVLDRDKLAEAAQQARALVDEYGGLDHVSSADLHALVSQVCGLADAALAAMEASA